MAGKKNLVRPGAGARRSGENSSREKMLKGGAMNDESMLSGSQLDPVDAARAVQLGEFVSLAYSMYGSAPTNPAPNPPPALPFGYIFAAWVQMRDFVFESGDLTFYGLIAHSPDGSDVILAIRGTETAEEWWDDITSLYPTAWNGPGKIGYGFSKIYQTLKVVPYGAMATAAAPGPMQPAAPPPPFAKQVADLVARIPRAGARSQDRAEAPAAPAPINVVGHSLGSALATLYVVENVALDQATVPLLCTFASPEVGDSDFVAGFAALPNLESWRIVNVLDVVPHLQIANFVHVQTPYTYNSGFETLPTPSCWHSLDTYLHLLDANQPIDSDCQFFGRSLAVSARRERARTLAASAAATSVAPPATTSVASPAMSTVSVSGKTITITVKIEMP
jgi:hypothetical protein